ncbi:MAG TPA: recombinase family protein [Bradyrhizobium sp.]|nr:recombinase family protein [Bradyrhizobium sp.]
MIRAAIYARFSSDRQNDRSVDDQIASCRELCTREGFAVVLTFCDREISGASIANRPGFQDLMRAAETRRFDVIVAEDVDRISRDQGDWHTARKRLDFLGIAIHTASGKVGKLDGALRALMGEMFLENLVVHTRRGLEAVVRSGRHAGGRAYGYRAVAGKPGELDIDEAEAEIVRRIFREFVDGKTPREIASGLNADRIRPPRGKNWNASTINGNAARGHGMLLNELYAGRIVWNKVRMIKDPATGRRVPRPNKPDQYRKVEAPQLAIVDSATFKAAQAVKAGRSHQGAARSRKPVRPLSGLLRCGFCGAGMSAIGAQRKDKPHRIQCSAFRESGACTNGRKISRQAVEALVFEGLREELANPEAIAEYVRTYNAERRRLAKASGDRGRHLERRVGEIGRELERLVDAITQGVDLKTIVPRIKALETERDQVKAALAQIANSSEVVTVHPAAIERYLADIARLADVAADAADIDEPKLVATLRQLVQAVVVHAPANTDQLTIEIKASLSELTLPGPLVKRSIGGVTGGSGGALPPFPTPTKPTISYSKLRMMQSALSVRA